MDVIVAPHGVQEERSLFLRRNEKNLKTQEKDVVNITLEEFHS